MPEPRGLGRRHRPRRGIVVGTAVVIILVAAGVGAYAATDGRSPTYRTATVARASVDRTLAETGTAASATSVTASFANAGTVTSVGVRPGQRVTAGQTLAQLDTVGLNATLAAAKATAAQDALVLADAQSGQLAGAGQSGSAAGTPSISGLQEQVMAAQKSVDGDLARAGSLLTDAEGSCPAPGGTAPSPSPPSGRSPSPSATPSDAAGTAPSSSPTATPTSGTAGGASACLNAEAQVLAAQQGVARDEARLASAESALTTALTAAEASLSTGSGPASGGSSRGGGTSATGRSTSAAGGAPTAADLAADQAAVDAAEAAVAVAQQNLSLATLVSPISGTVLSVGLTVGASSSGESVVVADPDAYVFDTTVPVTSVPEVAVGQSVAVVPDGTSTSAHGTVVRIGAAPDSSGDYPVVIGLTGDPPGVRSGSTASLTITLSATGTGLSVPTSAITTVGPLTIVRTLTGSTVTAVPVTVVTMGSVRSIVTGRLAVGDQVVLADLRAAVPASNSTTTAGGGLTSRFGGAGGLGRAGGRGAGGLGGPRG